MCACFMIFLTEELLHHAVLRNAKTYPRKAIIFKMSLERKRQNPSAADGRFKDAAGPRIAVNDIQIKFVGCFSASSVFLPIGLSIMPLGPAALSLRPFIEVVSLNC